MDKASSRRHVRAQKAFFMLSRSIYQLSRPAPLAFAALGAVCLLSGAASAHIHLLEPVPRYPDEVSGENKNCPCGVGTGGRTCTKPEERSDPNRSADRATELLGGSMLTIRLDEYVGHDGRYRIAFDPEGADVADFNQHVLTDIPDPRGNQGNSGNGSIWQISARLPNIDCENCTLQIVQVMNGDTENPVADTVGQSTYYQCADVTLTRDPSLPEGYAEPLIVQDVAAAGTGGSANAAGAGGSASSEAPVAGSGGSSGTSSTAAAGSGTSDPNSTPLPDDEGGCSVVSGPVSGPGATAPGWFLAALAALAVARARRSV